MKTKKSFIDLIVIRIIFIEVKRQIVFFFRDAGYRTVRSLLLARHEA